MLNGGLLNVYKTANQVAQVNDIRVGSRDIYTNYRATAVPLNPRKGYSWFYTVEEPCGVARDLSLDSQNFKDGRDGERIYWAGWGGARGA